MRAISWMVGVAVLSMPAALAEEGGKSATPTDETMARVVELEASVKRNKASKDENALAKNLDEIAALHKATTTEAKHRARLNSLIGVVMTNASDGLAKTGLKTIGDLGDADNWKHVRKYVIQGDPKSAPPLLLDGIDAAGKLKAPGAVDLLLKIVCDSKVYPPAAAAMKALGQYGGNKRVRAKILEEIVTEVRRSQPGGKGMSKGGQSESDADSGGSTNAQGGGDASRWATLSPALVEAANNLTGKTATSAQDWFDLYDRYKSKIDTIFEK